MRSYHIDYSSFLEMADLPNFVQSPVPDNRLPFMQMHKHHPRLGNFSFKSLHIKHIHIMELAWDVRENIMINNTNLSDTVRRKEVYGACRCNRSFLNYWLCKWNS